jgi:hypothetical protein
MPILTTYGVGRDGRLWPCGLTNGWKIVKAVMRNAGIAESLCKPKALRHAFAVEAGQKGNLARRAWSSLELAIPEDTIAKIR